MRLPVSRQEHHERVDNEDSARKTYETEFEQNDQHADDRAQRNCFGKDHQIVNARIAPDAAIHSHCEEGAELDKDQHRQGPQKESPGPSFGGFIKLDRVRAPISQGDQQHIKEHFENAPLVRKIYQECEQRFVGRGNSFCFLSINFDAGQIHPQQCQHYRETKNRGETNVQSHLADQ